MDIEFLTTPVGVYAALAVGFLLYMGFRLATRSGPTIEEPIVSNNGSVMMYAVQFFLGWVALVLGILLLRQVGVRLYDGQVPASLSYVVAALFFAFGIYLAHIALLRAKDAGRTQAFAFMAVVPIVNLAMFFAAPAQSETRPPYRPNDGFVRFGIGITCFVLFGLVNATTERMANAIKQDAVDLHVVRSTAADNERLPQQLDSATVLQSMMADAATRQITIRYTITLDDVSPLRFQARVDETVRPEMAKAACEGSAVGLYGWSMRLIYLDEASTKLAETVIDGRDC